MKLKDNVQIDVLKTYGFQLVEHNPETGFKRYTKHYGSLLATVCNNRLEKRIHLTFQEHPNCSIEGKRIVASIHQFNKDMCILASKDMIEIGEEEPIVTDGPQVNDWNAQMAQHNPFSFLME